MELFETPRAKPVVRPTAPLAERLRPTSLDDFVGQDHLLGPGRPLRILIESDRIPSLIFWGPPGSGKTTLARIIAGRTQAEFFQLSAVTAGVKDVREVLQRAETNRKRLNRRSILFIDEIHRFNKAQQDALLHSVEDGVITLVGATTENPSFEVIPPLLSRCSVYVLNPLSAQDLTRLIDHALSTDIILSQLHAEVQDREALVLLSGGDARMLFNALETAIQLARRGPDQHIVVTRGEIEEAVQRKFPRYDNAGQEHYSSSRHLSRVSAGAIPMRRCTGWRGCSREGKTRNSLPAV